MSGLIQIWKNKGKILEGIKNSIFRQDDIEHIAEQRKAICDECPHIDLKGDQCMVAGTQPCCGKCGCSLTFKLRSLSSQCGDEENPRWDAILSEEEEDTLKQTINYQEPDQDDNDKPTQIHGEGSQV